MAENVDKPKIVKFMYYMILPMYTSLTVQVILIDYSFDIYVSKSVFQCLNLLLKYFNYLKCFLMFTAVISSYLVKLLCTVFMVLTFYLMEW